MIAGVVLPALGTIAAILVIGWLGLQAVIVVGGSMEPSLNAGDVLACDEVAAEKQGQARCDSPRPRLWRARAQFTGTDDQKGWLHRRGHRLRSVA